MRRPARRTGACLGALMLVALLPAINAGPVAAAPAGFTGAHPVVAGGPLRAPRAVALDPAGSTLFATDTGHDEITAYAASSGAVLSAFGAGGSGPGQLSSPGGIAVDGAGDVFVSDTGNSRIEEFTTAGAFVATLGSPGTAVGQLSAPAQLAVDSGGGLYVADAGNNRIQHRAADGTWTLVAATSGATGLAVDSVGVVYVANTGANQVETMTSDGTVLNSWTGGASFLSGPSGIALDGAGSVFVADTGHDRVVQFDTGGTTTKVWGSTGSATGQFRGPLGIAVHGTDVYVADTGNDRVAQWSVLPAPPPGTPAQLTSWSIAGGPGLTVADQPTIGSIAVAADGTVVVPELNVIQDTPSTFHYVCSIAEYDATGNLLRRFATVGSGPGQICSDPFTPKDFLYSAVDSSGTIYLEDDTQHRVSVWSSTGTFIRQWPVTVALGFISSIAVDDAGHLFAISLNGTSGQVTEYDDVTGAQLTTWSSPDVPVFKQRQGIVVDRATGELLVDSASTGTATVSRFTAGGVRTAQWSAAQGGVTSADALTIDARGHVLVMDGASSRVGVFASDGTFISSFSTGVVSQPPTFGVDAALHVYINGGSELAIYAFAPPVPDAPAPAFVRAFGGPVVGPVGRTGPQQQVAVGPDGSATVTWSVFDGSHFGVWEATRAPGAGVFGAPRRVEPTPTATSFGESPVVATAADGSTAIAWEIWDGTHFGIWESTRLPGAATFGAPHQVQASVSTGDESPRIAAGVGGTTLVWNVSAGTTSVVWEGSRTSPTNGFATAAVDPATGRALPALPDVAVGPDGSAVIAWQQPGAPGASVWEATRRGPAGAFGAPVPVSLNAVTSGQPQPRVAIGGDAAATIVFEHTSAADQLTRVWAATRTSPTAAFAAAQQVEQDGLIGPGQRAGNEESPTIAAGSDGTTTVAWQVGEGARFRVWAATRGHGSASFTAPIHVQPSADGIYEEFPQVAVGPDGSATIVYGVSTDGQHFLTLAATRGGPTGPFAPPTPVAADGSNLLGPFAQVAAGRDGQVTVVWQQADSTAFGSPITVWENTTATPAPTIAVAARITGAPVAGTSVTCTGSWVNASTVTFQWLRDQQMIAGATGATYRLVAADVGHLVRCAESATNAAGTASRTAAAVRVLPAYAPLVSLVLGRAVPVAAAGRFVIVVRCAAGKAACAVHVIVRAPVKIGGTTRVLTLATATATAPAGRATGIALRLTTTSLSLLRSHRSLNATVSATSTAKGRTPYTATAPTRLHLP